MNTPGEGRAEARRQKLLTQFEDPKVRGLWADRSARLRRLYLVLFLVLLITAALTMMALAQSTVVLLGACLVVVLLLIPQNRVLQVLEAGSRTMYGYELVVDERQRTEIDEARNVGHSVTTALLVLAVAITGAAHLTSAYPVGETTVPVGVFLPVAWVVLALHRSFPVFYLAWTQPGEPQTEDDEPVGP